MDDRLMDKCLSVSVAISDTEDISIVQYRYGAHGRADWQI